jgi:hypothetical protein
MIQTAMIEENKYTTNELENQLFLFVHRMYSLVCTHNLLFDHLLVFSQYVHVSHQHDRLINEIFKQSCCWQPSHLGH